MKYLLILLAISLGGCVDAMQFYRPYTAATYPAKPKDHPIRIFGKAPEQKHQVIGRLAFQGTMSHGRMIKAVESVARRVGADAGIMLRNPSRLVNIAQNVPGYTERREVTTQTAIYANLPGHPVGVGSRRQVGTGYSTSYVPVVHQGYTAINTRVLEGMDVLMIVYDKR